MLYFILILSQLFHIYFVPKPLLWLNGYKCWAKRRWRMHACSVIQGSNASQWDGVLLRAIWFAVVSIHCAPFCPLTQYSGVPDKSSSRTSLVKLKRQTGSIALRFNRWFTATRVFSSSTGAPRTLCHPRIRPLFFQRGRHVSVGWPGLLCCVTWCLVPSVWYQHACGL